jgi:glycosyltransferase involved in cell wall biosynthesis/peptidoglycan/xylan/chitin deacetylase (PgdA/CDA1 family)
MLTDIYYFLKPILPWRLRISLRRWRGQRRRNTYAATWPIDPVAATAPAGWPGWPDGKKFAFVLTHDVEGMKGFERVPRLMELTQKYGFRASFNFVPKGEYCIDRQMQNLLSSAGFELGVHGLEHDGKLYSSKKKFAGTAAEIRKTLHEFGACGFRSPLMQHKLGWIHQFGCEYDASTFDVDPFEPQPDGMATIFPFWVFSGDNIGYVEMPYTMVQDFTLFKVLGEKNIDIWKKKLDWVAEHGGTALINTHPDYMCFGGKPKRDEYPVSHYEELLRYARERYGDTCWHALPREVSRYYCDKVPVEKRNTRRKICMIAYSHYSYDNRVRRYAETLARRGDIVDVISLSWLSTEQAEIELNGVTIYNAFRRVKNETSPWDFALRHLRFMTKASSLLRKLHKEKNYDVIHIHNIPDFLVFAAWYPKCTGAKLILDIHDVVPELFENKFRTGIKKHYVTVLRVLEKVSIRFVDHVIVSNHLWYDKLIARSADENHCSVLVNHVDPEIFARRPRTRNDGKYIVLFPGSFQWHQGVDIGIRAFSQFRKKVPNAEFHLYGGGNEKLASDLKALVQELGLQDSVKFFSAVPLDEIVKVIVNADLGVVPKRADSFGNEAYSTKIMEFMSQGVPVVVSRTKIDSYYFKGDDVRFFPSGDADAMAEAMCEVAENQHLRDSLIANGLEYVQKNSWTLKREEYLRLIDDLATERFPDTQPKPGLTSVLER